MMILDCGSYTSENFSIGRVTNEIAIMMKINSQGIGTKLRFATNRLSKCIYITRKLPIETCAIEVITCNYENRLIYTFVFSGASNISHLKTLKATTELFNRSQICSPIVILVNIQMITPGRFPICVHEPNSVCTSFSILEKNQIYFSPFFPNGQYEKYRWKCLHMAFRSG